MIDIDFLPIQYHQKNAYRHAKPWQIIVVTSFLGLVAVVTISQYVHRQFVARQLSDLTPAYGMALGQMLQLTNVQTQLKQMEKEAELITYLHHPWPRSQLLSAFISRLPEEITLQQLQITVEADNAPGSPDHPPTVVVGNSAEQQKSIPPAERDLQTLQNQFNRKRTVIILNGTTTDSAQLHHFLNDIPTDSLFSKAELCSITNVNDGSGMAIQFQAKLVVKPGYCQVEDAAEEQKILNPPDPAKTSTTSPSMSSDVAVQSAAK
jgi:hypothetical protein